jgi:hypothetical protein
MLTYDNNKDILLLDLKPCFHNEGMKAGKRKT